MPSAARGKLDYEAGQTATSMSALTDSGDQTTYTSAATLWSRVSGFEPDVRPNGVISGCEITPHTDNNKVSVAAGSVYVAGVEVAVSAGTVTLTRQSTNDYKKFSITVDGSGTLAQDEGTEHTAFSDVRDATGGPPLVATTVVELGQVHLSSQVAAPVAASEIKTLLNVHRESALFPGVTINYYSGTVTFVAALMVNHTGSVAKVVSASYASPSFSEQVNVTNYTPVSTSYSVTSTQVYNGTVGAESSSLAAGGFTVFLQDGVTDPLFNVKGEIIFTRFYPVRTKTAHVLGQARLGMTPSYPSDNNIQAACTLTGDAEFVNRIS